MSDKALYQQKKEAEVAIWKSDILKLKAKASMASADAQIELNKSIDALEKKIDEGKVKLSNLIKATDDIYESMKNEVESSWDSMTIAFSDMASKFKN
jgi:predicted transcriptional regulator